MRITTAWLYRQRACADQVALFRATFGESADVTTETLATARMAGLDVWWMGHRVLTASALAEYQRVTAPAWAECQRVTAAAVAEYERVTAAAVAEYERVAAAAVAEYQRVRAPAAAEYERVRALAWAQLLADPVNWRPEVLVALNEGGDR